jgi:carboxyl-terminal processing protease
MSKLTKRILFISALCAVAFFFIQALTKHQALHQVLFTTVRNGHVAPQEIDDAYSMKVFDRFIESYDPGKYYFTQKDMERLSIYKRLIDDELRQGTFTFYNLANAIIDERVAQIHNIYPKYLDAPIDLTSSETLETDPEKRNYPKNEAELEQLWRKRVKHQVLGQYLSLVDGKMATENESVKAKLDPSKGIVDPDIEAEARKKVKESLDTAFKRRFEEDEEDKREVFLDALLNVFDTHTSYFPPEKKEDFDISLSGKLEGIGAVLSEKDGQINVVRVIPGSAAWRQGDLEAGDVILKVAEGDADPVDIVGLRVRDAVRYIRGKKGTEVRLTVKKAIGEIKVIPIVRDIVIIEETYAKGAVIRHTEYKDKIGYINLPKFYRDFSDSNSRNTTDDIRKLLIQLKKSRVEGIILDLRNNEGGALRDAVDTAGLFVEKGPMVVVKGTNRGSVLRDTDRSVYYDGPLIVLINSYSASASEIVAAALQDYGRAVIVGSESSFGKGTVQTFVNLDQIFPRRSQLFKDLGSVKLTIQKFYRVNGGSTQYKGVIPDIILPDNHKALEVGEKFLDFSLPWDTTDPVAYQKWDGKQYDLKKLQRNSQVRIANNDAFKTLIKHYDEVNKERDRTKVSLNLVEAYTRREAVEKEAETFRESRKPFTFLKFSRPKGSPKPKDNAKKESEKEFHEALSKDLHLVETIEIMHDMLAD